MAARLMNELRNTVVSMAVSLDQLTIAFRLLDRVKILTLDIFNQRQFCGGRFVDFSHDRGYRMQPRALRGAPTSLAGDDLKPFTLAMWPKENRLEDSPLRNRIGELVDGFFTKDDARLVGIGPNSADLDFPNASTILGPAWCRANRLAQKRR